MEVFGDFFVIFKDVALLVPDELAEFNRLLAIERAVHNFDRKSPFTVRIHENDENTVRDMHGLTHSIKAALYSHDPQVVKSARILDERLQQLGIIYNMHFDEQTATITKLTDDFTGRLAADATKVGVNLWVTYIMEDNEAIKSLMSKRAAEISNRPSGDMRFGIRPEIEAVYKRITGIINANIVSNGEALCGDFVRQLNVKIAYVNEHDVHHHNLKNIADAIAAPIPVQTCTGKVIIPIPELHYAEEGRPTVELIFTVDFTVTYKDNLNAGDAEIIVHGKGNFKGQKIITFNIAFRDSDATPRPIEQRR
ncbi:MAG: DUF6261 family protein [Tannerella sp.]|nr:DUF6261 family protein [Tannerella sp.]